MRKVELIAVGKPCVEKTIKSSVLERTIRLRKMIPKCRARILRAWVNENHK